MLNNANSIQLFQSKIMEKLTRTYVRVPLVMNGAALGIVRYTVTTIGISIGSVAIKFVAASLFFTLMEYFANWYVFHLETGTEIKEKVQYDLHGVHQDYPKEKDRLAMPLAVSVVFSTVLIAGFCFVLGLDGLLFGASLIAGYASYLVVHDNMPAFKPPRDFLKYLRIHSGVHYSKDHMVAYNVSASLWRLVSSTMPNLTRKK